MHFGFLTSWLARWFTGAAADALVKDPLTADCKDMPDIELDMPDYAIEEELTMAELGEFCVALAGSVEKGFSLNEGVRIGRRAADMRVGKHSLLHFHLWDEEGECHELQVRMAKAGQDRVLMHFMAEGWAVGKVVGALNRAKGRA
jgi:hypothetical protein